MQRTASTLAAIAAVLLALGIVAHNYRPPRPAGHSATNANPAADTDDDDGGGLLYALGDAGAPSSRDAGAAVPALADLPPPVADRIDGGPGSVLLDGSPVPALPMSAPRAVRFGVVLVSYAGAQPSQSDGHPSSRSRSDALALATKLENTAREDFHAAVLRGDSGSADDLGTMKLGLLEPAPEYVLFTLPVGGVGGPVDTPRGYWVVKRIE
ncbi:MAG: peptidyl-prolyl cis-trans isomerase [Polyangiaceae bacterium]|nr:peptidyl-prolyl cis-trans isomerase [Polyangiaceae bacterium]